MAFGVDDALLIATLASSAGSGLKGGGDGQQMSSFEGVPGLDPREMTGEVKNALNDYLQMAIGELERPVSIDTTVAPAPLFTGGGLPMNIGALAQDPARRNPARRTLGAPDLSSFRRPSDVDTVAVRGGSEQASDKNAPTPIDALLPGRPRRDAVEGPERRTLGMPERTEPGQGTREEVGMMASSAPSPMGGQADFMSSPDLDQAVGGVELLMQQLRRGRG